MGFNLIITYIKRGSFYSKDPKTKNFFLDSKEELSSLYPKWTVHVCFESNVPSCTKGDNGEKLFNVIAAFILQKKEISLGGMRESSR
jgi:hypothetical protein